MLARAAANTEGSHSSIIEGSSAYQGHSLMYWGLFFTPHSSTHFPSQGSVPAIHSDSTTVCISIEDKGLVKENFYQNVSPLSRGPRATWCQVIFLGLESRERVCSVSLCSRSRSCPVSKPVCQVLAAQCVVCGVHPRACWKRGLISTQDVWTKICIFCWTLVFAAKLCCNWAMI